MTTDLLLSDLLLSPYVTMSYLPQPQALWGLGYCSHCLAHTKSSRRICLSKLAFLRLLKYLFICRCFYVSGKQRWKIRRFPGGSGSKEAAWNYRRPRFNPWVGKIRWTRKWQPTPVFLPREFHGQRSLVGYSPWGYKESDPTEWLTISPLNSLPS